MKRDSNLDESVARDVADRMTRDGSFGRIDVGVAILDWQLNQVARVSYRSGFWLGVPVGMLAGAIVSWICWVFFR